MWELVAEYAEGTEVRLHKPYTANGTYSKEAEEQYKYEAYLIGLHDDCIYYSVDYVDEEARA